MPGATTAWKGAISLAGIPVNVMLMNRVKSNRSGGSFSSLGPDKKPLGSAKKVDSKGSEVKETQITKGWKTGSGKKMKIVPLTDEQIEKIQEAETSTVVEPEKFVPADSIPRDLAVKTWTVIPDPDVHGADQPVSILWSGLLANELALITTIVRGGGKDELVAFFATDDRLLAAQLPYEDEIWPAPEWKPTEISTAKEAFDQFAMQHYDVEDSFDLSAYASEWKARREEIVAKVAAGEDVGTTDDEEQVEAPAIPDLLAALQDAKAGKAKGKKPAHKTPAAKKAPAKKTSRKKVTA